MELCEIDRLRRMKGEKRLWFSSEFSTWLLSVDYEQFPGLGHEFLEARRKKSQDPEEECGWEEYKLLLRGNKFSSSTDYHSWLFKTIGKFLATIPTERYRIQSMGIEEIDCSEPDSYYILLYFICNGETKSSKKEKKEG